MRERLIIQGVVRQLRHRVVNRFRIHIHPPAKTPVAQPSSRGLGSGETTHLPVSASRCSAVGGSSPVGIGPTSSSSEPPVATTDTSVCTTVLVVL